MALSDIFSAYTREARKLAPNFSEISKLDLANGYCDADEAGNESLRSQYWAALILRYWFKIFAWMRESSSTKLEPEEFAHWLEHALYIAFYYRSWRWEYEAVVKEGRFVEWKLDENGEKILNAHYYKVDPYAADRSINYFCSAQRGLEYQRLNCDKYKTSVFTDSLDSMIEVAGDAAYDNISNATEEGGLDNVHELICSLLSANSGLEALILDGIAYQNAFKETKLKIDAQPDPESNIEYSKYTSRYEFSKRMLVKHLRTVDDDFMQSYFKPVYGLDEAACAALLNAVQSASNVQLYRYIDYTLKDMRTRKDLLQHIAG